MQKYAPVTGIARPAFASGAELDQNEALGLLGNLGLGVEVCGLGFRF